MAPDNLKVGDLYYFIGYQDEALTRPMIHTCEYLGVDIYPEDRSTERQHFFRFLETSDEMVFTEPQLEMVADIPGLIKELERFCAGKHKMPPEEI